MLASNFLNGAIFVKHVWLCSLFYYLALFHVSHYTLQEVIVRKIIAFMKQLRLQSPYSSFITPFVTQAPECSVCLLVLNHVILLKLECFCLCRVCLLSICWTLLKGYLTAEGLKNEYLEISLRKVKALMDTVGSIFTLFLGLWQFNLAIEINFWMLKINSIKK